MKINTINVQNVKALEKLEIDLKGCSIMVTGGNSKGKSTALSILADRMRGVKPKNTLRDGEEKGSYVMGFDDGSSIEWNITKGSEKFVYTTSNGIPVKSGVLSTLGTKFFGTSFSIDKLLAASPREQVKTLTKLLGIDLSKIDADYAIEYKNRAAKKVLLDSHIALKQTPPVAVEEVVADNKALTKAQDENAKMQAEWKLKNDKHINGLTQFNNDQINIGVVKIDVESQYNRLQEFSEYFGECIDFEKALFILNTTSEPKPRKPVVPLESPKYHDLKELTEQYQIDSKKETEYKLYLQELETYTAWVNKGKSLREDHTKAENAVLNIVEQKKQKLIDSDMPEGFNIVDSALMYNGFALNDCSTSAKYIAALKLGKYGLGDLKTLHFDASPLDGPSLKEVYNWAEKEGLQLMIERPDFDGGQIKYEFLESK